MTADPSAAHYFEALCSGSYWDLHLVATS